MSDTCKEERLAEAIKMAALVGEAYCFMLDVCMFRSKSRIEWVVLGIKWRATGTCTNEILYISCCNHLLRYKMLSPGEMQQVAFARLFYHRPPFAGKP